MLASILQEAGYKVGLHTSPHLTDFRERIRINGQRMLQKAVVDFVETHRAAFEPLKASFFEWAVAMAFAHFAEEKVDVAVVEVGMGGRLDSTNILTPELSIITNIGWDHAEFLGNTLGLIAGEKAGIIKPGIPVVIGERHPETAPVFERIAKEQGAPLLFAEDTCPNELPHTDLRGAYQQANICTVSAALPFVQNTFPLEPEHIRNGLLRVQANTDLRGRWQLLDHTPLTIADVAHNEPGLRWAMNQLQEEQQGELHIVWGMANDKEVDQLIPLLPKGAQYHVCAAQVPRAMPTATLTSKLQEAGLSASAYPSVSIAYQAAHDQATAKDTIYIGGSIFVVAEVL